MVLNAGRLNRQIQIQRATETRDEYGNMAKVWDDYGVPLFASRQDVSDGERMSAGKWDNMLVTRFVIRATPFARNIFRYDRLVHEGVTYEIDGIKEVPNTRGFLEITAQADDVA